MKIIHCADLHLDSQMTANLTKEQARQHPRRNVLLQCVGVQEKITPEWKSGVYYPGMGFLICSDGFCNQLLDGELEERFCRNYLRHRISASSRISSI